MIESIVIDKELILITPAPFFRDYLAHARCPILPLALISLETIKIST